MRVALISYHTSPLASLGSSAAGGMNVYVRRLAEGLAARGVEVNVFTRRDCADAAPELEFSPGARLITVRAGPAKVLSKEALARYMPDFRDGLARYVGARNLRYDAVHSHYWLSGLSAQALCPEGQPVVHMFHTLKRVKQLYQPEAGSGDPESRDYAELSLLRSNHTLVFSTEAEVDDVERAYGFRPASVAFIPPGVDQERFAPREAAWSRQLLGLKAEKVVLFVGRMDRAKGVDFLLEAVARIKQTGLGVVIVGGDDNARDAVAGQELSRLRAIAAQLGIADLVDFRGVVPQEDLSLYYSAADVVAVPSRYESFGMVALEGLASGRPVVGFRSRGLEQTVRTGRTGFLVDGGDIAGLAGAVEAVLSNPCLARRMGMAARESVKNFGWQHVVDRSLGLYNDLIEGGSTGAALKSS